MIILICCQVINMDAKANINNDSIIDEILEHVGNEFHLVNF